MKGFIFAIALSLVSSGAGLVGQQSRTSQPQPSSAPDSQAARSPQTQSTPDSTVPQAQADATTPQPSARAFEGKIQKSGDEFVLEESISRTSYRLDDQSRAKHFDGKDVRVMATIDPTTNKLHVVDITRADTE